jgi:hypothetical protein
MSTPGQVGSSLLGLVGGCRVHAGERVRRAHRRALGECHVSRPQALLLEARLSRLGDGRDEQAASEQRRDDGKAAQAARC